MSRTVYYYSDACRVIRHDYTSGKKRFVQQRHGGSRWVNGAPEKPWPLYQVHNVPDDNVVLVVEGDKCAEAVRSVGLFAITSLCGSGSARHSDWSPVAQRDVVIVPDNDGAGAKYADEVAAAIRAENLEARIRVLRLAGLGESQDVADFIEHCRASKLSDHRTRRRLTKLTEDAPPHVPGAAGTEFVGEGRNNELTSLAGKLRRDGLGESAMLAALLEANRELSDDPLPEDEVKKIAKSVARYPAGPESALRAAAEFQPFPTSALPPEIRAYVVSSSARGQMVRRRGRSRRTTTCCDC